MATAAYLPARRPRRVPPWHRLAYVARRLPIELEALARTLPEPGRVLDYGAAESPYRDWFPRADWVAADLAGNPDAAIALREDGSVPVDDASFDLVISTQVLEHAGDPALHLRECARVLRPGGRLLLSTHGIMAYHPDPVDLWRWTPEGLRRLVGEAGLAVERTHGVLGQAAVGLQLVQDAVLWSLPRWTWPPVGLLFQGLVALADRLEPRALRDFNPCVVAVVACRP